MFESQMQALHDVVQAGYVRYIGMSSCWAWQCMCLFVSRSPYIEYPSQSMQCKVSLHHHSLHSGIITLFFSDYAINNKLTPFISMQNHYNLLYREEEREMFPTLKVRLCHLFYRSKQTILTFNTFLALGRWCDSLVPSCSRSSCASLWT